MTTLVQSPLPIDGPSYVINPLPFILDSTCPIALPSKPLAAGSDWPYQISGPSTLPEESKDDFIRRRYYETLYLSETLSSLSEFTADLFRLLNNEPSDSGILNSSTQPGELIKPLLLSLPEIEDRNRKIILPLLSASSKSSSSTELMSEIELKVIKFALELRLGSRQALDDGIVPLPKKLSDELEKRETLMQIILLLLYSAHTPIEAQPGKKRKRSKHSHRAEPDQPTIVNPTEDPKTALELLMDRLSVWQAVSELGLSLDIAGTDQSKSKGKGKVDENSISNLLGRFWKSVMVPFFLPKQSDSCSLFHQKVFGHPIPPKLLPTPISSSSNGGTTKKPRKPKLTKPILSKDSLKIPPPPITKSSFERSTSRSISNEGLSNQDRKRSLSRVSSRTPSENGSFRASPPPPPLATSRENSGGNSSMKRSLSRTSIENNISISSHNIGGGGSGFSRSRSRSQSIDPISRSESLSRSLSIGLNSSSHANSGLNGLGIGNKQGLVRNKSSGKDLFKSREVGLMRRTISTKKSDLTSKDESQSQSQSSRFGLLGRKTSNGKESQRRNSTEESQKPNTLILATPSKPRNQSNPFFRSTQSQSQFQPQFQSWIPPTPIHEEESSSAHTKRPSYIAETPVAPMRIATKDTLPLDGHEGVASDDDDDDDPLGELWELTDEEDDYGQSGSGSGNGRRRGEMVPETPMK